MKAKFFTLFIFLFFCTPAFADWTSTVSIKGNYFEGTGDGTRVVLIVSKVVHSCGWNDGVQFTYSNTGDAAFKSFSSAILTAIASGKNVQLNLSGCEGDRGKIVGVRLI